MLNYEILIKLLMSFEKVTANSALVFIAFKEDLSTKCVSQNSENLCFAKGCIVLCIGIFSSTTLLLTGSSPASN